MSADGLAVGASEGGVGVDEWRPVEQRDVADSGQNFEMLIEVEHPVAGEVRTTGSPIRVDGSAARAELVPATLGQHTTALLGELGLDDETISTMIEQGTAVVS